MWRKVADTWSFKVINVRCIFWLIFVTRELIVDVLFHDIIDWEYPFLIRLDLIPVVRNLKRPIFQTFN